MKPPSDKEIHEKLVKAVEFSIWTDGYNWSFWKTGGGWGEVLRRYKPYKPKEKKEGDEDTLKGKGKAPVKVLINYSCLKHAFNPLPHMPILGSPNSVANKDMKSKILTNWDEIILFSRKHCGKRRNCSLRAISSFPTMFSKTVCC